MHEIGKDKTSKEGKQQAGEQAQGQAENPVHIARTPVNSSRQQEAQSDQQTAESEATVTDSNPVEGHVSIPMHLIQVRVNFPYVLIF